jgi:hypothetical protein
VKDGAGTKGFLFMSVDWERDRWQKKIRKEIVANTMRHQSVGTPTVALHKISTLHSH